MATSIADKVQKAVEAYRRSQKSSKAADAVRQQIEAVRKLKSQVEKR